MKRAMHLGPPPQSQSDEIAAAAPARTRKSLRVVSLNIVYAYRHTDLRKGTRNEPPCSGCKSEDRRVDRSLLSTLRCLQEESRPPIDVT